jgi:formylglycine-generating enzyme required for sulfatase activity
MRIPIRLLLAALVLSGTTTRAAEPPKQAIKLHRYGARFDEPPHVTFTMVRLPAGKITLKGPDGKDKDYDIKPIWIATHETRWDEYDIFWLYLDVPPDDRRQVDGRSRPSRPYDSPDKGWGHDGFPAGAVTWASARQYVAWLSKQTGKKFRLPTEAEWEYACRAGGAEKWPKDAKELDAVAWHDGNSDEQTRETGTKKPNAWGLYDMLGNVAEWVTTDDPKLREGKVAGGSYVDKPKDVHPGARKVYHPDWQHRDPQDPKGTGWYSDAHFAGLRVVMD